MSEAPYTSITRSIESMRAVRLVEETGSTEGETDQHHKIGNLAIVPVLEEVIQTVDNSVATPEVEAPTPPAVKKPPATDKKLTTTASETSNGNGDWNNYGRRQDTGAELDAIPERGEMAHSPDLVRTYLIEIGRVALLSAEQEVGLAKRMEAGLFAAEKLRLAEAGELRLAPQLKKDFIWLTADGQRAHDHLIEANLRLGVSIAKRYQGRGLSLMDLIQEGSIGLFRAAEKFDYTKGYKFSTYATWWIRQALQRAIADQGRTIRVPVHMVEQINKALRVKRYLEKEFEREPTFAEIGQVLEWSAEIVEEILGYGQEALSLETPVGDNNSAGQPEATMGDYVEDVTAVDPSEAAAFTMLQERLGKALQTLPERQRIVLELRSGIRDGRVRTLDEVGKELGVVRERVRQIERDTLASIRKDTENNPDSPFAALKDYL